jgi:Domain of unknown function (DUF3644)
MAKRMRRVGSVANELVKKSREAMLTAVQIYNNPQIDFKSELFIVTTVIAWTYLLHAYYRKHKIDYRQLSRLPGRKKYATTPRGAVRLWSLEECLGCKESPVETIVKQNLLFLIGIRHEIEHQGTSQIDDQMSAKFMSAALNFNAAIKKHFGQVHSLEKEQAFSIQFSTFDEDTAKELVLQSDLPANIRTFITDFERGMSEEDYNDPRFSFRVAFIRKLANAKASADRLVEFVPAGTTADEMNRVYVKETEKTKYRPKQIVDMMKAEGYKGFTMHQHTELWQALNAKQPEGKFGTMVAETTWLWYPSWINEVRKHCEENTAQYRPKTTVHPAIVAMRDAGIPIKDGV